MSVIYFTTSEKEVFPYWSKAPEIGLRRIMALISLASKTGLTGSKTPIVRDRNGRVIDGLVVDSSDAQEIVERLTQHDFSKDWSFQISIYTYIYSSAQNRFIRLNDGWVLCRAMLKLMLLSKIFETKRTERYWRNTANSVRITRCWWNSSSTISLSTTFSVPSLIS